MTRGPVLPGTCQYCGCSEIRPCCVPPTGETCCWMDVTRNWCSNPACIRKHHARLKFISAYSRRLNRESREKMTGGGRRRKKGRAA